jgi:hypothetical protein
MKTSQTRPRHGRTKEYQNESLERDPPQAPRIVLPPWPGYPLSGCFPAEPDSVSPSGDNIYCASRREAQNQPNAPTGSAASNKVKTTFVHLSVLTRPSVAGSKAPRDIVVAVPFCGDESTAQFRARPYGYRSMIGFRAKV